MKHTILFTLLLSGTLIGCGDDESQPEPLSPDQKVFDLKANQAISSWKAVQNVSEACTIDFSAVDSIVFHCAENYFIARRSDQTAAPTVEQSDTCTTDIWDFGYSVMNIGTLEKPTKEFQNGEFSIQMVKQKCGGE